MNVTYAAVALLGTAALAACGTQTKDGGGSAGTTVATSVTGTRWVPEKITVDGKDHPLPDKAENAFVKFEPEGAKTDETGGGTAASVGCNHIGADVEIEGDTIRVTDVAMTEMACADELMKYEERFAGVFSGELKAKIDKGEGEDGKAVETLVLTRENGDSITLRAQPAPPLEGTRWTVDAFVTKGQDGTAESLPEAARGRAHLTFAEDGGKVSGNLGCNNFSGEVTIKGGTISFGDLATTRRLCAGPVMKTEDRLRKILSGEVDYELNDGTLTLTADTGKGVTAVTE
ncbi:META domain-containing protein [Streptomyces sp. GC420]|uniref:META domain-containing protein n=1 Tax=Streptomyces sp. GC420 TaxID=2697568 RepID=UPI0014152457|nr:META domain-containing protein [Streptomyces sp. GC420]NBM18442.1 META domain-containing protein [Streptomyces sp. GC420]